MPTRLSTTTPSLSRTQPTPEDPSAGSTTNFAAITATPRDGQRRHCGGRCCDPRNGRPHTSRCAIINGCRHRKQGRIAACERPRDAIYVEPQIGIPQPARRRRQVDTGAAGTKTRSSSRSQYEKGAVREHGASHFTPSRLVAGEHVVRALRVLEGSLNGTDGRTFPSHRRSCAHLSPSPAG